MLDPFSDVLRLLEARSVLSGGFTAGGTWAIRFPPPEEIKFSAVVKGACWITVDGIKKPIHVEEGDVGLLPGRRGFVIGSAPNLPFKDASKIFNGSGQIKIGKGSDTLVLAGGVALNPDSAAFLTEALPPLIHIKGSAPQAAHLRWIVQRIAEERTSTLPGSTAVSAQLAQLLFVEILRSHLANEGVLPVGWLRAVRDVRLAPALKAMHSTPGRGWSLDALAKTAGMSRTAFAVHFHEIVGVAPMTYLAQWRMRLAKQALRDPSTRVAQLSESLGYSSESAFTHAFKRVNGVSPRQFRKIA